MLMLGTDGGVGLGPGAAAYEADAAEEALEDARLGVGAGRCDIPRDEEVATARHGHQREGAESDAVARSLPVPADGESDKVGAGDVDEVRAGGGPVEAEELGVDDGVPPGGVRRLNIFARSLPSRDGICMARRATWSACG